MFPDPVYSVLGDCEIVPENLSAATAAVNETLRHG
jgi:hypothetical protein